MEIKKHREKRVALLAEGVDRNKSKHIGMVQRQLVALLAEGVDRNTQIGF